ncbi:MAG: YeeE/YedE thiosulfate transporter family protein [Bryobacteraceae bacterium]
MMPMLVSAAVAFVIALVCAVAIGFAIQRGSTCAVTAVSEFVNTRSASRLGALLEAQVWVLGLLVAGHVLFRIHIQLPVYELSAATFAGGLLLGVGAWINGACLVGLIGRIGSGDLAFVAAPIGFFLGRLSVEPLLYMPKPVRSGSIIFEFPGLVLVSFLVFLAWRSWRIVTLVQQERALGPTLRHLWHPRTSTTIIGIAFAIMVPFAGMWAYTEVLADIAGGRKMNLLGRCGLFLALLLGSVTAGVFLKGARIRPLRMFRVLRCLSGGVIMAWGSALVPGGNDALSLVGQPFLLPYAWTAMATMYGTLFIGMSALAIIKRKQQDKCQG